MMNLGDGPFAIMSKSGSGTQEEVHAGGMIGEFKLLDFNLKEITLEWDGRVIHKRADDAGKEGAPRPAAEPIGSFASSVMPGMASAPMPAPRLSDLGPGADNGNANRPCLAGDSSPAGAIADGYRKSVRATLFGSECHWEPVGK